MYEEAQRPVIIFGWGVHLAGAEKEAIAFAERTGIPVCLTWGAADLLPHDHPLRVGTFGTHGNKYANLAIQNADLVISVGSRLDTKATAFPVSAFAPRAKVVVIDIDRAELDKFKELGREVTAICSDAKYFFKYNTHYFSRKGNYGPWLDQIAQWKAQHPMPATQPYGIVGRLASYLRPDDVIVSDTGCSLAWMMQAFKFSGQRYIHAFNQTPMGYGLPAAVGAAFATGKRTILVTGDGGLSVNITEFATVARHRIPIKILLFNNHGHAMCRQTQRQWLKGKYPSTSFHGGLAAPNFPWVADAYQIPVHDSLDGLFSDDRAGFLELVIDPELGVEGQIKFGEPLAEAA